MTWEISLHREVEAWYLALCRDEPETADLIAGDKAGNWDGWYRKAIPLADERFTEHLATIDEEEAKKR